MKERLRRFRSFWIFPMLAIVLLIASYPGGSRGDAMHVAGLLLGGVVIWSLLEYFLHRFLLHAHFRSRMLQTFVNASHLQHHAAPRDRDQILVQLPFALVTSAAIYAILYVITRDVFDASAIISGIWAGFLYYEAVHYRVHVSLSHSALLQQQRRAHFYHHFSDSEKCFGVTSPAWDYVFGTMRREARHT